MPVVTFPIKYTSQMLAGTAMYNSVVEHLAATEPGISLRNQRVIIRENINQMARNMTKNEYVLMLLCVFHVNRQLFANIFKITAL